MRNRLMILWCVDEAGLFFAVESTHNALKHSIPGNNRL